MDKNTKAKWKRIEEVLDDMGLKYDTNYCNSDTSAIIEFWTDTADQDIPTEFDYDGTPEGFVKEFTERAENYDVDEEVELYANMRGKNGVPNTIRELLDDCQEAKDTLMKIAERLQKALKNEDDIKTYQVTWTQTLRETFTVEAECEEEAIEIVFNNYDVNHIVDNDFKVRR